jgi:hypothetical protein
MDGVLEAGGSREAAIAEASVYDEADLAGLRKALEGFVSHTGLKAPAITVPDHDACVEMSVGLSSLGPARMRQIILDDDRRNTPRTR